MEELYIRETALTPMVRFNAQTGELGIKGRSIPEDADEFWVPILSWFESFVLNPTQSVVIRLDMEYFNISSSKRILFILYKLNDLIENGIEVKVEWHYKLTDIDMYEVGQDYAYMVKVPFNFISYAEPELISV